MQSLLGPTSTFNYEGTTGLGTLVKTVVRALAEGLATFDTALIFSHTSNDVELCISGSRIIFVPIEYEAPVNETLVFLTNIIPALNGVEQRIALRKNPRQIFEVLAIQLREPAAIQDGVDQARLFRHLKSLVYVAAIRRE